LVTRWLPPGYTEETTGAPKFLGNPNCPFAHVQSTPAGLFAPDHYSAAAWPLVSEKQRLPRKVFRSSIAWRSDWLSTLRSAGHPAPRKTRFRPLVRPYRTGFPPARFQRKVSDQLPFISSSLLKLLGAIGSTEGLQTSVGRTAGGPKQIAETSVTISADGSDARIAIVFERVGRFRPVRTRVSASHQEFISKNEWFLGSHQNQRGFHELL
jgi:hypothetical protein